MPSSINLPAIFIANIMGITILFAASKGNFWIAKEASKENQYLRILFLSNVVSCIADPICFIADGKPGIINYILVVGCNSWLYFGNLLVSISWVLLVAEHLKVKLSALHRSFLYIFASVVALLIIVNLFTPIFFIVDENNVYSRTGLYLLYSATFLVLIADSLIIYYYARVKSGNLKFFPIWSFIIPAFIGLLIQSKVYGVSTINPFITVSITCVIISFQNEFLCRDSLTGLYNRFYLDTLKKRFAVKKNLEFTAMMLDINGFKKINDIYGHKAGDNVLILLSSVLTSAVEKSGEVIRYAGDEFIIILNTSFGDCSDLIISKINSQLDEINRSGKAPYELSVSIGNSRFNFDQNSSDEILDKIDKLMYENKKEYYKTHSAYERRK